MALLKRFKSLGFRIPSGYQLLFANQSISMTCFQLHKHKQNSHKFKSWSKYKYLLTCSCGLLTGFIGKKLILKDFTVVAASPSGLVDFPESDTYVPDGIGACICELSAEDVDRMRQHNPLLPHVGGSIVYVAFVENSTPASKAGMCKGDVIIKVDGNCVQTAQQYLSFISRGGRLKITVIRNAEEIQLTVNI